LQVEGAELLEKIDTESFSRLCDGAMIELIYASGLRNSFSKFGECAVRGISISKARLNARVDWQAIKDATSRCGRQSSAKRLAALVVHGTSEISVKRPQRQRDFPLERGQN